MFKSQRKKGEGGEGEGDKLEKGHSTNFYSLHNLAGIQPWPRSEMPGKPHPDRYPGKLPGRGWCLSPEPGQCYFLGNHKSHRMKAMTECLGQGGRPGQEVGVEQEQGRRGGALAGFAQTNLFFSQTGKSCLGCAHL